MKLTGTYIDKSGQECVSEWPLIILMLTIVTALFVGALLFAGCKDKPMFYVRATGNNGDGTVNIEYFDGSKYHQESHISVDSLLTLLRNKTRFEIE